jgi:predicted RNase H-like nuclease (RuvC/YqgF family)
MTTEKLAANVILSREELGKMYFELQNQYERFFSPWSNMCAPSGDPEVVKLELRTKIEAIEKELGDYIDIAKLRRENRKLETHLKDQIKNNDELEERIERLEECVVELVSGKKDKRDASYTACYSKIPSKMNVNLNSYPSLLS